MENVTREIRIRETSNGFLIQILERQPTEVETVVPDGIPTEFQEVAVRISEFIKSTIPHTPRPYELVGRSANEVMDLIGPILATWQAKTE